MRLYIEGAGPLYDQAKRLADAAGLRLVYTAADADLILPATEDDGILKALDDRALFDPHAWALCSSRSASDDFLREHGIPINAAVISGLATCGLTHKEGYMPIFRTTVLYIFFGMLAVILMCVLFPGLAV